MTLSEAELSVYLSMYSSAKSLIPTKDKPDWAFRYLDLLQSEGVEIQFHIEEFVETCPYLDKAMSIVLEDAEEEEDLDNDAYGDWDE